MKPINLKEFLNKLELRYVKRALDAADGNRAAAACLLGMKRTSLVMSLDRLGLKEYKKKVQPVRHAWPPEVPLE